MSTPPRPDRSRRRSRNRKLLLGALLGLLAGLAGCGETYDPLKDFDDGAQVEVTGVVHFPATTQGDFLPGRLVAKLSVPLNEVGLESLRDRTLPGANVILSSEDPQTVRFDLPLGMSLAAAAARLEPTGAFSTASPEYLSASSSSATLRSTSPGVLLKDSPLVATLVAEDLSDLREVQGAQVVKIRARTREDQGDFTPTDLLKVDAVEVLAPYSLQLTGHVTLEGDGKDCLLLHMTDGRRIELTGSQAIRLTQTYGVDRGYTIRAADLGMTTSSCSGGPVIFVQSFELAS